jgi:hypothetical protein
LKFAVLQGCYKAKSLKNRKSLQAHYTDFTWLEEKLTKNPLFIIIRQLSAGCFPALLVFIITVLLTSCTIPLGPVNAMPKRSIEVSALSKLVDPPEVDTSPKETVDAGFFTISFSWYDTMEVINPDDPNDPAAAEDDKPLSSSDFFERGRIYRVELLLTPDLDFEFSNPAADVEKFKDFGYSRGGKIISGEFLEDTGIKIGILFDPIRMKLDLTEIAVPQAGTAPQTALVATEGLGLLFTTGRIVWTPNDAVFRDGVTYEAALELERKNGYTFQGLDETEIRHNGNAAAMSPNPPGPDTEAIEVTITFDPIEIPPIEIPPIEIPPIEIPPVEIPPVEIPPVEIPPVEIPPAPEKKVLDLRMIAAPRADTAPQTTFTTGALPFTAETISWVPKDAVFRYGVMYEATLLLTRKDGYSFQGLDETGVLHNGKIAEIAPKLPGPDTETIKVTITFNPFEGASEDNDSDGFSNDWEEENLFDPDDPADGGDVYVSAFGDDGTGKGTEKAPYKTLTKAVWKAKFSLGEPMVIVTGEISEGSGNDDGRGIFSIIDTGSKNLTIRGRNTNARLKKMTPAERSVLYLGPRTKVTLETITITGGKNTGGGGIYLDGGDLTLGEGAVITGNTGTEKGGGIYAVSATLTLLSGCAVQGNVVEASAGLGGGIYGEKTTVIMKDGAIAANHCGTTVSSGGMGGGIYLTDKSTFDMTGGEIIDNEAVQGGGAAVNDDSSFTMANGVISGNTAAKQAGGVLVMGSTWTLKGGYITGNVVTGDSINGDDSESKRTSGGGLMLDAGSMGTMEGGYISYNTIVLDADKHGGGVYLRDGSSFTMKGGEISNNNAGSGGGIYLTGTGTGTTFTMTGGTIYGGTDPKANTGNGQAVYDNTKTSDKPKNDTITQYP